MAEKNISAPANCSKELKEDIEWGTKLKMRIKEKMIIISSFEYLSHVHMIRMYADFL